MENGTVNGYEMDTPKNITIKGILSLLMESIDENNHSRSVISLGMGDPTAHSCFHTTHVAPEAVVDALQSGKFNGYAPTVGLPQTRRVLAIFILITVATSGSIPFPSFTLITVATSGSIPFPSFTRNE
ncbi:hypothetical protein OIU78_028778 [Salix suchowensis]|nr:hypothetical protein OIU78_028778 [Salix suchowensis]